MKYFCSPYKKVRRPLRLPLLLFLLSLFLTACSAGDDGLPPEAEDGVLVYAALNPVSGTLLDSVEKFNKAHTDVQIEIRDYSDENGAQRILTELVLGRVPDIMEMRRLGAGKDTAYSTMGNEDRPEGEYWMPYRQLVQKGYLENLWPYIENDPELGREGVLEAPLKAAEIDGGLYMLFPEVSINTLMGPEHIVGSRSGWTLEELMETFSTMPEGSTILRYTATKREMFSRILCTELTQYVNMETGECSFDSKGFRDILKFLNTFPDKFETNLSPSAVENEFADRILGGYQMLEMVVLDMLEDVAYFDAIFAERAVYVGYPTEDGSLGSFFYLHGNILAMSSTCREKESAWAFMSQMIRKRYNSSRMLDMLNHEQIKIPVNLANYKLGNEVARKDEHLVSFGPIFPSEPRFEVDRVTRDDLRRFETLVNSTMRIYWPDNDLSDIVWESCGPYFAGDKTLDEAVQMIQNRVKIYVNEQR